MEMLGYLPWILIVCGVVAGAVALVRTRVVQKQEPRQFNYFMTFIEILSDQVGRAHFGSPVDNTPLLNYARVTRLLFRITAVSLLVGVFWLWLIQPATWVV